MRKPTLHQIIGRFHTLAYEADDLVERTVDRLADNAEAIGSLTLAASRRIEAIHDYSRRLRSGIYKVDVAIGALVSRVNLALLKRASRASQSVKVRTDRAIAHIRDESAELRDELNRATRIRDRVEAFLDELIEIDAE